MIRECEDFYLGFVGLFHRCIAQSGPRLDIFYVKPGEARKIAWKTASALGCANDDVISSLDLVTCLRKLPAKDVIKSGRALPSVSGMKIISFPRKIFYGFTKEKL